MSDILNERASEWVKIKQWFNNSVLLLCVHINRFAVSFISWGMNFSTPFVGGSVYSNVAISAGASLPSYLICAVLTVW